MLSRLAEAVYWSARYIERVENTARIIVMHHNMMLDVPCDIPYCWEPVISLLGTSKTFYRHYDLPEEKNVVEFLIASDKNPSSIRSSIAMARENLRTARAEFPRDAWECINKLYWYSQDSTSRAYTTTMNKRFRFDFLRHVIGSCQQFKGILNGTMSYDTAHNFMRIGNDIERADMTTRVIDVRAVSLLLTQNQELKPYEDIKWMNLLKSLAAYQMYRQYAQTRVTGSAVLTFLLQDRLFPRSVHRCLTEMHDCLNQFKQPETVQKKIKSVLLLVENCDVNQLVTMGLHEFMDELQLELSQIHQLIDEAYFTLGHETQR